MFTVCGAVGLVPCCQVTCTAFAHSAMARSISACAAAGVQLAGHLAEHIADGRRPEARSVPAVAVGRNRLRHRAVQGQRAQACAGRNAVDQIASTPEKYRRPHPARRSPPKCPNPRLNHQMMRIQIRMLEGLNAQAHQKSGRARLMSTSGWNSTRKNPFAPHDRNTAGTMRD